MTHAKMIRKFGYQKQFRKTCEEIAELTKEILKFSDGDESKDRKEKLIAEFHDVLFTLEYISIHFGIDESNMIAEHLKRSDHCKQKYLSGGELVLKKINKKDSRLSIADYEN